MKNDTSGHLIRREHFYPINNRVYMKPYYHRNKIAHTGSLVATFSTDQDAERFADEMNQADWKSAYERILNR